MPTTQRGRVCKFLINITWYNKDTLERQMKYRVQNRSMDD
jgi:hypothetical protein